MQCDTEQVMETHALPAVLKNGGAFLECLLQDCEAYELTLAVRLDVRIRRRQSRSLPERMLSFAFQPSLHERVVRGVRDL
jgi:hypothetical protein